MSDFAASLIGKELAGYKITQLVGEGGMAVVMKAENLVDSRIKRAFKVIRPEYQERPQFYERFTREALALESLRSPHLVIFHGLRLEENYLFMELELLEGFSLEQRPKTYDQLQLEKIIEWIYQAALGLAEAHRHSIIHRDIKPANLFIHQDQTLKILDFGIAKVLDELDSQTHSTLQGHVLGSPAFMAPEVCEGKVASTQADVYSLALIAYQLILGRHPLLPSDRNLNTMQVMLCHLQVELPSIQKECIAKPKFELILKKAASKDPKLRYRDGMAFAKALSSLTNAPSAKTETHLLELEVFGDSPITEPIHWRGPLLTLLLLLIAIWSIKYEWKDDDSKVQRTRYTNQIERSTPPKQVAKKTGVPTLSNEAYLKALNFVWISIPEALSQKQGKLSQSILKTEVTVEQYKLCVKADRCKTFKLSDSNLSGQCTYLHNDKEVPMNCVSYQDAQAFAQWANELYQSQSTQKKQNFVKLPTLQEWRSAIDGEIYPWKKAELSCQYAIFFERSPSCEGRLGPQKVCSRPLGNNQHGACDLYGNLWEWVSDRPNDRPDHAYIVGGSWSSAKVDLNHQRPKLKPTKSRDPSVGIRLIYQH